MPEEVLFETERRRDRTEIANMLRRVASNLEAGDPITLRTDTQELTLSPPARPTFEVKAEREGPADGSGELSVEFEIEWDEGADDDGDGDLKIE